MPAAAHAGTAKGTVASSDAAVVALAGAAGETAGALAEQSGVPLVVVLALGGPGTDVVAVESELPGKD